MFQISEYTTTKVIETPPSDTMLMLSNDGRRRARIMISHTYFDLKLLHAAWKEIALGYPLSANIADLWSTCMKVLERDPVEILARDVASYILELHAREDE